MMMQHTPQPLRWGHRNRGLAESLAKFAVSGLAQQCAPDELSFRGRPMNSIQTFRLLPRTVARRVRARLAQTFSHEVKT